jgi:outer membrane receptor protein involved in Fe transport
MTTSTSRLRALLLAASALAGFTAAGQALAQDASGAQASAADSQVIVTVTRATRSAVTLSGVETQKILPGVSPLKAIESLPGVLYETADPWGNNEQNEALVVHGFTTQQLGYTLDGVPLGDQQYGNYNGLSVSRAVTSENVGRVTLESGAGSLGVASTSNLGGAIETFSSDPTKDTGFDIRETAGSYDTTRTFGRFDTGEQAILAGGEAFFSYLHHDARAWDFDGHQRDDQANAKYVRDDARGKLTLYADWDSKVEPNEDSTSFGNQQTAAAAAYTPSTRPFIFPNIDQCIAYVAPSAANGGKPGTPPTAAGNNFTNCFSAAQRVDDLLYAKYDFNAAPGVVWSNQAYYHYDYGRGIVAGPINQGGLPGLFAAYYPNLVETPAGTPAAPTAAGVGASANQNSTPTLQNITNVFGGSGYEVRTTEYRINRGGLISTLKWQLGDHQIEAGVWWEHNEDSQHRAWYPFSAQNNDLSPYEVPDGAKAFTQYYAQFFVNDEQLHIQDQWRILPNLVLQAGWKASLQTADGKFPINQVNLPYLTPASSTYVQYPSGSITSNDWFLPQVGATWDVTDRAQMFFNVQKNMRQFVPYGAGGNFYATAPWSLGNQAAFNLFKSTAHPETSWTYEVGARGHTSVDLGILTAIEGQASYYHVNFANRLFNVAPYSFINPAPSIIVNVGGVTSNGVDVAATLHFGPHFQLYDGVSYNTSTYDSNYSSGTTNGVPTIVPIQGKEVPLTPDWLNKVIASTNWGPFEAQINGDYVGRRFVTYLNDLQVPSTILVGLEASYTFDSVPDVSWMKSAKISLNVTNLNNEKGVSTAVVTGASGGYQAYPIAPTMGFVTLQAKF